MTGDNFLQSTYNAILIVSDFPVKDLYSISNVHFKDIHVDGTGTSVLSARSAGNATFQNVDARNVGAVGINNCGSFHFTPAGSEFTVTDLGGNDGGGTTGPWLAPWELRTRSPATIGRRSSHLRHPRPGNPHVASGGGFGSPGYAVARRFAKTLSAPSGGRPRARR